MTNLTQRWITGIIGGGLMIAAVLWNEYSFSTLFLFIAVMSLREFYSWCEKYQARPHKILGMASGVIVYVFLTPFNEFFTTNFFLLIIPSVFGIFIMELYTNSEKPFINIALTILGVVYIVIPLALVSPIAKGGMHDSAGSYHPLIVIGYLFIIWANDVGGYFFGKKFGKKKLFERISPKKTWEGSIGGAFLALLVAIIVATYFDGLSFKDWIVVSCIVIVTGTYGDLVESLFKRSIQIKDSGTSLPGHGGFLDRFDAFFISAPFVFLYLSLTSR